MSDKCFIDTNIFAYSIDSANSDKQRRAKSLIEEIILNQRGVISTQVLQELYVVATRKLGIRPTEARKQMEYMLQFELVIVDAVLIKEAIDCSILDQISYWDALLVVSAANANCASLLTEDLNHGQMIKGVRVNNIFK